MDMNNIANNVPSGEVFAKHINSDKINKELKERFESFAEQLNPEAADQLIKDGEKLTVVVVGDGEYLKVAVKLKESYLISYLANHGVPKSGGENGIAHNVDGTIYTSSVPVQLQGEELESLMLPIKDLVEESQIFAGILLQDEVDAAKPDAINEIKEMISTNVKSYITQMIQQRFGGGSL